MVALTLPPASKRSPCARTCCVAVSRRWRRRGCSDREVAGVHATRHARIVGGSTEDGPLVEQRCGKLSQRQLPSWWTALVRGSSFSLWIGILCCVSSDGCRYCCPAMLGTSSPARIEPAHPASQGHQRLLPTHRSDCTGVPAATDNQGTAIYGVLVWLGLHDTKSDGWPAVGFAGRRTDNLSFKLTSKAQSETSNVSLHLNPFSKRFDRNNRTYCSICRVKLQLLQLKWRALR